MSPPDNYFPGNAVALYQAESHSLLQLLVNLGKNLGFFPFLPCRVLHKRDSAELSGCAQEAVYIS